MHIPLLLVASMLFATELKVENVRPIVSPSGRQIEFTSNRSGTAHVYIINPDGTGERRLTEGPGDEGHAQWSANGKRMWLFRFANDATSIYSIDLDGKHERLIGTVPGRASAISPDGKRVVHWTGTWTAVRLLVSDLDGAHTKELTDGTSVAWGTQWSPDGKQLAFGGHDAKGVLHVFLMSADGSNRRQLTHLSAEEGSAQMPAWSRDGQRIAFQADHGNVADIWVINTDGSNAHRIGAGGKSYIDETPWWFPDGKRLAYVSNRSGAMQVWVMNADGSEARQVTK